MDQWDKDQVNELGQVLGQCTATDHLILGRAVSLRSQVHF